MKTRRLKQREVFLWNIQRWVQGDSNVQVSNVRKYPAQKTLFLSGRLVVPHFLAQKKKKRKHLQEKEGSQSRRETSHEEGALMTRKLCSVSHFQVQNLCDRTSAPPKLDNR